MNNSFDITIIGSDILSAEIALIASANKLKTCFLLENKVENLAINKKIDFVFGEKKKLSAISANNFIETNLIKTPKNQNSINQKLSTLFHISKFNSSIILNKRKLYEIEPVLKKTKFTYAINLEGYKYNYSRLFIDTAITAKKHNTFIYNLAEIESINNENNNNIILFKHNGETKKIYSKILIFSMPNNIKKYIFLEIPRYKLMLSNPLIINLNKQSISILPYYSSLIIKTKIKHTNSEILTTLNKIFNTNIIEKEIINSWTENYSTNLIQAKYNQIFINEDFTPNNKTKIKKIFNIISKKLNISQITYNIELYNNFKFEKRKSIIFEEIQKNFREVQQTGISPIEFTRLFYKYGCNFSTVAEKAFDFYNTKETRINAWNLAENWFSDTYETL